MLSEKRRVEMEAERLKQIKIHAQAIAELLYEETDSEKVKTLEGIEETVRKHLIDYVNPEVANFLSQQVVEQRQVGNEL
jgi:predicted nucleic acid-binding protein